MDPAHDLRITGGETQHQPVLNLHRLGDLARPRQLRLFMEMAGLAVNRHHHLRVDPLVHLGQFIAPGVTRHMDKMILLGHHLHAEGH